MRIVVTEVTRQGSIRRGVLDTAWHSDADRCKDLVKQAALDMPPPYRPEVGRPVYEICVDDKIVWVAWRDLAGPLRELVTMTVLTDRSTPSPARGEDQRLTVTQPLLEDQVGHEAARDVAGAQPEDMSAPSPDRPEPGARRLEPLPGPGK